MSAKKGNPRGNFTFQSEEQKEAIDGYCKEKGLSLTELVLKGIEAVMNGQTGADNAALMPEDRIFAWFPNATEEKLIALKKGLGIDPQASEITMTETALMQKATELSGIPYDRICKEGRRYQAQKLITSALNTGADSQGRLGAADHKLSESYVEILEETLQGTYNPRNGLISVTAIGQWHRPVTNYNTVIGWVTRYGLNELFETHSDVKGKGNQGLKISWLKQNPEYIDKTREKLGL